MPLTADKLQEVLDRIVSGESQASIAESLGVNPATLCRWLQADELTAQRSARAREDSAEAWLDHGMATLRGALDKSSGIDATAARAYAQECARRAAVRNPRYSDKVQVAHSGKITTGPDAMSDSELAAIAASAPKVE